MSGQGMSDLTLYPKQEEAVQKMSGLESFLLGDKPGTGKTFMQGEELRRTFAEDPTNLRYLIVTVKSAIDVWIDWLDTYWLTDYYLMIVDSTLTEDQIKKIRATETPYFVITNWSQVRLRPELQKVKWNFIIADEGHALNNRKTQQTKAFKRIKCQYKRLLSGSFVNNEPADAWSPLNWMFPRRFTSYWQFFEEFVDYDEDFVEVRGKKVKYKKVIGVKNAEKFRAMIDPFFVSREKGEVIPHYIKVLDPQYIPIDLSPQQHKIYKQMTEDMLAWVGELGNRPLPAPIAIAQNMRLQQFCAANADSEFKTCPKCKGTGKIIKPYDCKRCAGRGQALFVWLKEPSSKLDMLMDIVNNRDDKLVVFSESAQLLDLAVPRFEKAGVPVARYRGGMSTEEARLVRKSFTHGEHRVFLSTIRAGGTGLDGLQHVCSTGIFLDRSWSPLQNEQAEGRLDRDGQKEAVQFIYFEVRNTIEQKRERKIEWKKDIFVEMLKQPLER